MSGIGELALISGIAGVMVGIYAGVELLRSVSWKESRLCIAVKVVLTLLLPFVAIVSLTMM
jgi:hypothetical protein